MSKKHRYKFDKLIRNKLPALLRSKKIDVFTKTIEKNEYIEKLKNKLREETDEVIQAATTEELLEELADVLEVIHALSLTFGASMEKIENFRIEKRNKKGGFDNSTYISHIEMTSDNPNITYYQNRCIIYPEMIEE